MTRSAGDRRRAAAIAAALALLVASADAGVPARCKRRCRPTIRTCVTAQCAEVAGKARRQCRSACRRDAFDACRADPARELCVATSPGAPATTRFETDVAWNEDVGGLSKSTASDRIVTALAAAGGWGTGAMRIDFSLEVLVADATTPRPSFTPTDDFYEPDCDRVPFPVPTGGALEGERGYRCSGDGDCHLLVLDGTAHVLYEMWRADFPAGNFRGGCAAVWDLHKTYPPSLRGEGCASADAGGLPIAAMVFSADEVAGGAIDHAVRFILPNDRIRERTYVRPATHSTAATSGGPDLPPYGVRLRLRPDFPLAALPSDGARVVARALQRFGMLLADGGQIALTAQSDRFTSAKWADVGVDASSLEAIAVTDMEVVDMGEPIVWNGDCVRNP